MRAFALILLGLVACEVHDAAPQPSASAPAARPVDAAMALGMSPVAVDARGVPRLLRASPRSSRAAAGATDLVTQLAAAWGVRTPPELASLGEIPAPGGTITRLEQRIAGVPIDRGELRVLRTTAGQLVAVSGTLIDAATPHDTRLVLDEGAALARALAHTHGTSAGVQVERSRATRIWFGDGRGLVAAWRVEQFSTSPAASGAWRTVIAADDGRVLEHASLSQNDAYAYRAYADPTGDYRPSLPVAKFSPHPTGVPDGSYPPQVSPVLLEIEGLDHPAGQAGPDPWLPPAATVSTGNNVDAFVALSMAGHGFVGSDFRATPSAPGAFDRTYDQALDPYASQDQEMAALTAMFFTLNWLHDFWYDAGFVEAAANAQIDNYGRGGVGSDPIEAEALDGSASGVRNNAMMATPGDGMSPQLQVFMWFPGNSRAITTAPASIPMPEILVANFGPTDFDVTAPLVVVADACHPLTTSVTGAVALVQITAACTPEAQALNVQTAGGAAMIAADASGLPDAPRLGIDEAVTTAITLPVLTINTAEDDALLAAPPQTVALHRAIGAIIDGDLDQEVVAHEFMHYVHHRLSVCGNPVCLGMSEGWADFDALMMMARDGDDLHGVYPVMIYATQGFNSDAGYFGVRRAPYSVEPTVNALTFADMSDDTVLPTGFPLTTNGNPNSEVHNAGEIWCSALWQSYVALQDARTSLSFEDTHQKMARYIVAGIAITPPDATPTEARDALLTAIAASSQQDADTVAAAFAQRGFGTCAQSADRDSTNLNGIIESTVLSGLLVAGSATLTDDVVACDHDGVLDAGETAHITLPIANTGYEPLTDLTLTLTASTPGLVVASAPVTIAELAPRDTATATFELALTDGSAMEGTFAITITGSNGCAAQTVIPDDIRLNVDDVPASSASDEFDSGSSVWAPAQLITQPQPVWTLAHRGVLDGYWQAVNATVLADEALVSPPLTASATAPVTIGFTHRFAFDPDIGAVVEYSTDGGVTWSDISGLADAGYNGTVGGYGTPLDGRPGFVDASAGYPATSTVSIDLGTQLAGQQFQIRFRIASSGYAFASAPPAGWELDEVTTTGLGTPFPAVVHDPGGSCAAGSGSAGSGSGSGSGAGEMSSGGGGCCDASSRGGSSVALCALLALASVRRRRARTVV